MYERKYTEPNGNFNSKTLCLYGSRLSVGNTPHFMGHSVILTQVRYPQSEITIFKDNMESLKECLISASHVNVIRGSNYSYKKAHHHDKKHL